MNDNIFGRKTYQRKCHSNLKLNMNYYYCCIPLCRLLYTNLDKCRRKKVTHISGSRVCAVRIRQCARSWNWNASHGLCMIHIRLYIDACVTERIIESTLCDYTEAWNVHLSIRYRRALDFERFFSSSRSCMCSAFTVHTGTYTIVHDTNHN